MVQKEVTGDRDLKYSRWHRFDAGHLSNNCKCLNIDFVEIRNNVPVAFIEVTETSYNLKDYPFSKKYYHAKILNELTKLSSIPSYIVAHNHDLTEFKLFYDLIYGRSIILSESQYAYWLEHITEFNTEFKLFRLKEMC